MAFLYQIIKSLVFALETSACRQVSFTVYIAFTGNLQKYELADYFPIKRNILDLIFMQTGHFLVKF